MLKILFVRLHASLDNITAKTPSRRAIAASVGLYYDGVARHTPLTNGCRLLSYAPGARFFYCICLARLFSAWCGWGGKRQIYSTANYSVISRCATTVWLRKLVSCQPCARTPNLASAGVVLRWGSTPLSREASEKRKQPPSNSLRGCCMWNAAEPRKNRTGSVRVFSKARDFLLHPRRVQQSAHMCPSSTLTIEGGRGRERQ